MRWVIVGCVSLLAACGRIAFDESTDVRDGAPPGYREAVLQDSPLAYWRLADFGATAHDETGQWDGMYMGGCTSTGGLLANDPDTAQSFDGTCSVQLPDALDFAGNAPFSVELWIREHRITGYQIYFMNETRIGSSPMDGYAVLESPTGIYIERAVNQVVPGTTPASNSVGVTRYVVGAYDGASLRLYVDGVMAGSALPATEVMPTIVGPAMIGSQPDLLAHLDGDLDEVAVYDHVLPADRIATHYDIGVNGPP